MELGDHLFRREAGRMVAALTRLFGVHNLALAEDVVQDAFCRALEVWKLRGVPENPSAWLLQTAQNRALDQARRATVWRRKQTALTTLAEDSARATAGEPAARFEDEIADSQLRMMFVCSHPGLPADAQVALILKTLCGFGEGEIASAFLAAEDAIVKKLFRARKFLRDTRVPMELPPASRLAPRVASVQRALYLLFNEGYKASHGDSLLRADLCTEAIRLGELLAAHPLGDRPETHALLALMQLNAARLPARVDAAGSLLLLAAQDRSLWDQARVRRGMAHLAASTGGAQLSRYHLEAGIAACHCLAPDFATTDWGQILKLYDLLAELDPSPVIALNRAIALARVNGAGAGLDALAAMPRRHALARYYLFHAVQGQLLSEAGRPAEAAVAFNRALAHAPQVVERRFLRERFAACAAQSGQ